MIRRVSIPYAILGRDPHAWPSVEKTAPDGILAIGGDLSPARLLAAYRRGIFPWYSEGVPILWHCPNPRFVLEPQAMHVPRSLEKQIRKGTYQFRTDTAFAEVIEGCAEVERPNQDGTWITSEMRTAYVRLHELGHAHSAESWLNGKLVGGVYGVRIGKVFFGESMFTLAPDASKVAFVLLVRSLIETGIELIDCQQKTAHLERFGAASWPREKFIHRLSQLVGE